MTHEMKLNSSPFDLIKNGIKTIEVRLYDKKREAINLGDKIIFSKLPEQTNTLTVIVEGILIYTNFESLFLDFPAESFGAKGWTAKEQADNMNTYYTKEDEESLGIVGIKILDCSSMVYSLCPDKVL